MKNDKDTITIRAGKPVTFFIFLFFMGAFVLLGYIFSGLKLTKYNAFDEDRSATYKQVYIEITELPVKLEMKGKELYYLGCNEENVYIFKLSQKQYDAIRTAYEQDGDAFRYRIEGKTSLIFTNMEEASRQAYNDNAGSKLITGDNYEEYFGQNYIDATDGSAGTVIAMVCYILACLFALISVLLLLEYIHGVYRIRKITAEYGKEELERQINAPASVTYPKAGICLAENYIISSAQGFDVIPYSEICWIYILKKRLNLITITQVVTAATVNGRLLSIAAAFDEKTLQEVIGSIHTRQPSIWVGYTPENRKKYSEYLKSRR